MMPDSSPTGMLSLVKGAGRRIAIRFRRRASSPRNPPARRARPRRGFRGPDPTPTPTANSSPRFENIASAGRRHRRPAEQIGLSHAQQQPGDGQHRDGQHQRPAQLLKSAKAHLHCVLSHRTHLPAPPVRAPRRRKRDRDSCMRKLAAVVDPQRADLALDGRHRRGHHRELAHAETQQYRHGQPIRRHAAADGHHLAGRGTGAARSRR